jgi:hypothetical protein
MPGDLRGGMTRHGSALAPSDYAHIRAREGPDADGALPPPRRRKLLQFLNSRPLGERHAPAENHPRQGFLGVFASISLTAAETGPKHLDARTRSADGGADGSLRE